MGSHLPPAPPNRPEEQVPDESGLLTLTMLATSVPVELDPVTVTQSPMATLVAATVTVLVKLVDDVQLTVTWPVCWFWTSIDDPEMEATDPDAPGNPPPPAPPPPPPLAVPPGLAAVVGGEVLVWLLAPQAPSRPPARTSPNMAVRGIRKGFMDGYTFLDRLG